MDEALYDEMFRLESAHWWFVAKRRIILSLLKKHLPVSPSSPAPRVCDIGCGCGMTLCDLQKQGYQAVGVDASETALSYCAARGVQAVKGSLPDHLGLPPENADAVLLLDVLEHLDDDLAAMLAAIDLLRPGGILIATVPAYQWLWTRRDEFHHHKRRYSLKQWRQLLHDAAARCGARRLTVSYFNTYLFPPALAGRLAAKVLPQPDRPGDMSIPPLGINRLLAGIFASERLPLCAGIPLPFGLSLLAVMRKPGEPRKEGGGFPRTEPQTIEQAVQEIITWKWAMSQDQVGLFRGMQNEDLSIMHFSLGLSIRNELGLQSKKSKLLKACGVRDPMTRRPSFFGL